MTKMKKFGALLLALVLVLSLSAPAFADADLTGDGIVGDFTNDNALVQGNTVILYKEITASNPDSSTVNAPTITYSYAIAAGSAEKDLNDAPSAHTSGNSVHVKTQAGIGNPTIKGSVAANTWVDNQLVFSPAVQLETTPEGKANLFQIKIDFTGVFANAGAGVYRYQITETAANKDASGITDGEISNTRFLDVYVNGNHEIYGYVCFTNNNGIDGRPDSSTVADAGKTPGFVAVTEQGSAATADQYHTYNLTVTKAVENDNYTKTTHHQFPFSITMANGTVSAKVLPIVTASANATWTALAEDGVSLSNITWDNCKIADEATIAFVGIPCGTQVTINETNDVVGVTYNSASTGADTNAADKYISTNEVSNDAVANGNNALAVAEKNYAGTNQITFTNTLVLISPTGVVLRIAPYALMLSAGIVLFVLSRKRKAAEEEA